jgi:hypothetical protein
MVKRISSTAIHYLFNFSSSKYLPSAWSIICLGNYNHLVIHSSGNAYSKKVCILKEIQRTHRPYEPERQYTPISMNFRMEMNTDRGIFVSGSPNGSRYTERGGRLLKYGEPVDNYSSVYKQHSKFHSPFISIQYLQVS